MNPHPPAHAFATVFFDELTRLGVRHVVLCPGSRSAPLAYAALAAERAGSLQLHVRTDERSAAFLALGIGKVSGVPAVVVTTSGTAVANTHPAVLEAHEARVPILIASADRPHELRWTRANQTTDQPGLLGGHLRATFDLSTPSDGSQQARFWRTTTDRAMAAAVGALGALPGPVHINIPLREPLTPSPAGGGGPPVTATTAATPATPPKSVAGIAVETVLPPELAGRPGGVAWTRLPAPSDATPTRMEAEPLAEVPRTLILVGSLAPRMRAAAFDFARRRGHVVIAEPFGTAPVGLPDAIPLPYGSLCLETSFPWEDEHVPDRILVVGRMTLFRAAGELLRSSGASCEVVTADPQWTDPSHIMTAVHPWSALLCDRPGGCHPSDPQPRDGWPSVASQRFTAGWGRASTRIGEALSSVVPPLWPSGPAVAQVMLPALPERSLLFLGSSSVVRDVAYVRASDEAEIIANRGLAGIDGCVSTAAGIALAQPDRPVYALTGDLTFAVDLAALAIGPDERRPNLTCVVVNDDGGAIFDTLEYGASEFKGVDGQGFRRLFTTPLGLDLASACAANGVRHLRIEAPAQLRAELARRPQGMTVLEVPVPQSRPRQVRATLIAAAQEAVRDL